MFRFEFQCFLNSSLYFIVSVCGFIDIDRTHLLIINYYLKYFLLLEVVIEFTITKATSLNTSTDTNTGIYTNCHNYNVQSSLSWRFPQQCVFLFLPYIYRSVKSSNGF